VLTLRTMRRKTTVDQGATGTMKHSEQRGKLVRSVHHHRIMTEQRDYQCNCALL
jgi:hypothetical protein